MSDETDTSGTNVPAPTAKIYRTAAGSEVVRPVGETAPGEQEVSPAESSRDARDEARKRLFDTVGDGVLTFAEGVVDAASMGLIHEHGEAADLRREVNSGTALVGQLVGSVAGIEGGGPLKWIAGGGRKAGQVAARAALGEASGVAGRIATRAVESAAEGAAVMGAGAFGSQLSNAIIEDKPFAMEVVAHEMGLGAILSGTAGMFSGIFSEVASRSSRSAVAAQGGFVSGVDAAPHVNTALDGLDTAMDTHAQHLGVLDVLSKEGHLPEDYMASRQAAYDAAVKAQGKAREITAEEALTHDDPKVYKKYRANLDDYQAKVAALDDSLRARSFETAQRIHLGSVEDVPGFHESQKPPSSSSIEDAVAGPDGVTAQTHEAVTSMRSDPAKMAEYEQIHGHSFEESDAAKEYDRIAELNGPKPGDVREPNIAPDLNEAHGSTPVDVTNARPARVAAPATDAEAEALGSLKPTPEFSANTGSLRNAREIGRTYKAIELDNVLSNGAVDLRKTAAILPDGYFLPAQDARAYGQAYSSFQDKMAQDTQAIRARKLESWKKAPVVEPTVSHYPADSNVVGSMDGLDAMTSHLHEPGAAKAGNLDDLNKFIGFDPASIPDKVDHPLSPFLDPKDPGALPKDHYVRKYIKDWAAESNRMGPRITAGDRAASSIRQAIDEVKAASGGRLTSASTLELGSKLGVHGATTPLGEMMDQAWTIRQAGKYAADEARGVATPLRKVGKSGLKNWLAARAVGAVGGAVGGPLGYVAAETLIGKYAGVSGKVAAASGRMLTTTVKAADSLLKGSRSTIAARIVAGNRPYQYSDRGAIKDPVERIQEIQRVAKNPTLMREAALKSLGDFGALQPGMATMHQDKVVSQMNQLSIRAPMIYINQLGKSVNPAAGDIRKFLEYENATHSFEGVLSAVANGSVTRTQALALQEQWPEVHGKLVQQLLKDPEALKGYDMARLRTIELITGYPLTPGSDPQFIARQQAAWLDPQQQGQALANHLKAPAPTSSQAQAKAPGN